MKLAKFGFIIWFAFLWLCFSAFEIQAQKPARKPLNFKNLVEHKLKKSHKISLTKICPTDTDLVAKRIFKEYGAIFISENGGKFPGKCIFENESEVEAFQKKLTPKTENFEGVIIELQEPAMNALLAAREEAAQMNLRITPRGGSLAGKRSFQNTLDIWNSRFYPALDYWVRKGKIPFAEAEVVKIAPIPQQVAKVLDWESKGIYFSTDLSKSILYSVAAPGTSQHIFMLALDIEEFGDLRVRNILAKHGWFQTVKSDLPHFTYLGVKEMDLSSLGLIPILISGQKFWIPKVD